ncbi:MAG: hypothetical protein DI533_22600 [Cereibacter sphaeroides]|uniref:Uncharacterized protein n=1 Tax=Cereibacter sphaeroides TaxID=1063 RepID=A0A2W5RV04_CERSP|nr:MAG: hypothetical protein DI533_22600 [Cereibacter sphaeroides]
MPDLSDFSLGQFEATKLALEEAENSGRGAAFQLNVEIQHLNCSDQKAEIVTCSYEMRPALDLQGTRFGDWKPVRRSFRKNFWTRTWVEAEKSNPEAT